MPADGHLSTKARASPSEPLKNNLGKGKDALPVKTVVHMTSCSPGILCGGRPHKPSGKHQVDKKTSNRDWKDVFLTTKLKEISTLTLTDVTDTTMGSII